MVIFSKMLTSIEDVNDFIKNSCITVEEALLPATIYSDNKEMFNNFKTYEDWVDWALTTCREEIPTPFSIDYPSCYNLTLGNNYFTIKHKKGFGFGIKVDNKKGHVSYEVSIVFYTDERLIKETAQYKSLINNHWDIKDIKKGAK